MSKDLSKEELDSVKNYYLEFFPEDVKKPFNDLIKELEEDAEQKTQELTTELNGLTEQEYECIYLKYVPINYHHALS